MPGGWTYVGVQFIADTNGNGGIPQQIGQGTWSPPSCGGHVNSLSPLLSLGPDITVVNIQFFSCPTCRTKIGESWVEGRGNFVKMQNFTNEKIFASYAILHLQGAALIPIGDLNPSLGGFGAYTSVTEYDPVRAAEPEQE